MLAHNLREIKTQVVNNWNLNFGNEVMATAGQTSLLCHIQLFLDSDYVFQKSRYLCKYSWRRWEERCVTPSQA